MGKGYYINGYLRRLEEGGQTALGPALLVSISLASRVPGSKVGSPNWHYLE